MTFYKYFSRYIAVLVTKSLLITHSFLLPMNLTNSMQNKNAIASIS